MIDVDIEKWKDGEEKEVIDGDREEIMHGRDEGGGNR